MVKNLFANGVRRVRFPDLHAAPLAQLVALWSYVPAVEGSSPSWSIFWPSWYGVDRPVQHGWVAEWSKALVLGTSLFGGVGSNPTPVIILRQRVFG